MDDKGYSTSTNETLRKILKFFYKVIYRNNLYYPEQVDWFSSKMGKEKQLEQKYLDIEEYLEEDEVIRLIEVAPTI